jgi:predicted lipid-binding transport protein (Tim44 family)
VQLEKGSAIRALIKRKKALLSDFFKTGFRRRPEIGSPQGENDNYSSAPAHCGRNPSAARRSAGLEI